MNVAHRKKARRLAVQAIYQWQLAGAESHDVIAQILDGTNVEKVDTDYFKHIVAGVIHHVDKLDKHMQVMLDRPINEVDPVERAILRIATYEFIYQTDTPYRVVINEAIDLAKVFGATDGYKYVNGVLDRISKRIRMKETGKR